MEDKNKKTMKQKVISMIGGKPNGNDDTFILPWGELKKGVWLISIILAGVIYLSSSITFIRSLRPRLNNVEKTQGFLIKRADKQESNEKYIKESLVIMRDDIRTLLMRNK